MWAAFSVGSDPARIDTIDADGVTLAALQGCGHKQKDLSSRAAAAQQRLKELRAALQEQEEVLSQQRDILENQAREISRVSAVVHAVKEKWAGKSPMYAHV